MSFLLMAYKLSVNPLVLLYVAYTQFLFSFGISFSGSIAYNY